MPEDATLQDRIDFLSKNAPSEITFNSWGRKTWYAARLEYLARYDPAKRQYESLTVKSWRDVESPMDRAKRKATTNGSQDL